MPAHKVQSAAAVVVAAGSSTRFRSGDSAAGEGVRKPFVDLGGLTVLEHACAPFDAQDFVRQIVVVARAEDLETVRLLGRRSRALRKRSAIVEGGAERFDSVVAGVELVPEGIDLIAVHDAARPLVSAEVVRRAFEVAARAGAALVATPVRDTIKTSSTGEQAESTLDRSVLWAAQTPQVFRASRLRELLERAQTEDYRPTDEAALHERFIGPIAMVESEATNLKITTQADLVLAEAIVRARAQGRLA